MYTVCFIYTLMDIFSNSKKDQAFLARKSNYYTILMHAVDFTLLYMPNDCL